MYRLPIPYRLPELIGPVTALVGLAIGAILFLLFLIIWWRIFAKAGYSGALSLLMLVPIANVIVILVLAFGRWPIEDEVQRLRAQRRYEPGPTSSPTTW